jgi:hypothetical protein
MPKSQKKSIRPPGRSPTISVRVSEVLYARIRASADANKRNMSEEMATLLQRSFDLADLLNVEAAMRAAGFQRLHGTSKWVRLPEGVQGSDFMSAEDANKFFPRDVAAVATAEPAVSVLTAASLTTANPVLDEPTINAQLDQINAELDRLKDQIRSLRSQKKGT